MATYTKFNAFVEALAEQKHKLDTDQLSVAFTTNANAPVATDAVLTDLTVISTANFDTINITTSSSSQTGGSYTLVLADLVMTATGGAIPTFQWVVIYNNTATNDDLIAYFDYGSEITLQQDETFTLDFGAQLFTLS